MQKLENQTIQHDKQSCRMTTRRKFENRHIGLYNRTCEVPGCNKFGQIHHWDYTNCLDITFLCKEHHEDVTKGIELKGIFRRF